MASKSLRGLIIVTLFTGTFFSALVQPVRAASLSDLPTTQQTIKFYLDPALATDSEFASRVLPKYVADMNSVLAKNTRRQLAFDPQADIIVSADRPAIGSAPAPLPTEGFELWAYVSQTTNSMSYGGYLSVAATGAGVLAGLNWTRLYDPDQLSSAADVRDYSIQISNMLHEMAHVFGAGIGEYYNVASITDTTGVEPLANINVNNAGDPYWSDKADFLVDPLLRVAWASTRDAYLQKAMYSRLTAAILNGDYRNGVASFNSFAVQVVDDTGLPVPSVNVKVWNVQAAYPYPSQLLYDVQTDENGEVTLPWGGTRSPHNSLNMLRLIKAYRDGVPYAPARYVSVFDADIAQLVQGQGVLMVVMQKVNQPPTDIALSNASVDENQPAGTPIGQMQAVDEDAGEAFTFRFCGGPDDASFQIAGDQLLTAMPLDYAQQRVYSVCLEADDGRGGVLDRTLSIQVNDLPDTTLVSIPSMGGNDGWVLESGKGSNQGGSSNAASNKLLVGNDANNRRYRSVLAFNKEGMIPENARLTRVALKVRKQGTNGVDPFSALGNMLVDVGKPLVGTSAALQRNDFQARVGLSAAGAVGGQVDSDGWYIIELDPAAYSFVQAGEVAELRLRFAGTVNVGASSLSLYSGNAAAPNRPVLEIEYELP